MGKALPGNLRNQGRLGPHHRHRWTRSGGDARMNKISRRGFLAAATAALALRAEGSGPTLCLFSKHLPDLNYEELGKAVRDLGFPGVDLTVRAKGHVLPERAAEDLPRAVEILRKHGLT